MAQVMRPQVKQDDSMSKLLTVGGAVGGFMAGGGPSGAMAGAGAGQMAGGFLTPQQAPAPNIEAGGGGSQAQAMMRRQQQLSQDNLATLKQAEAALPQLPESLRQQYAPAIVQARSMEMAKRGMA